MSSYCECGCGEKTSGEDKRFVWGHNRRVDDRSPRWAGGLKETQRGYVLRWKPEHPHAQASGYVLEHLRKAVKALGKPLPDHAEVHHVNGDPSDNRNCNLVICEDAAYHALLHVRMRAKEACGNPNWRKCPYCKEHDDPEKMKNIHSNVMAHPDCVRRYKRSWARGRREDA